MLTISKVYRHKIMRWPTRIKIGIALLGLLVAQIAPLYVVVSNARALSDTTPVTIEAFTASADSVTVNISSVTVNLNGTVSDNLSGFASMQVYYTSPSGKQVVEGSVVETTETSFQTSVTFPRYSEPGTWVPTATFIDVATNILTLTPQELVAQGFALGVTVTSSTPDTTAPVLTNFTIPDTSSISVVDYDIYVETDVTLTDELSGVAQTSQSANATIKYVSPNGKQSYSATFVPATSPDEYHAIVMFPQHVEPGIWLAQLTAVDNAGNTRTYDANDLTTLGFATAITVASEPDTAPVAVTAMDFRPLQQDFYDTASTFTGGPLVTVQFRLSDDYSGVGSPRLLYRSATTTQVSATEGWEMYNDSSTSQHQFLINLPKYAAEGDWLPELTTTDTVGNVKVYSYSDLLALGFDMKVTIGNNVTEPVAAGDTVSTDTTGVGATAANPVQAAVTSPVPGSVSVTAVDTASAEGDFTGYSLLPQQYSISAPTATPEDPLVLTFTVDSSQLAGVNPNDITIFRDGTAVGQCLNSNVADPDACVKAVSTDAHGDVSITVNSSHASQWVFGTKQSTQPTYTFQGFKKPVLAAPELNKEDKAGSSITVKFSLGGDFGLNVLAEGTPSSQKVNCNTLELKGDETPTVSTNGKDLKINGNDYYRYDWKTLKDWSGTCRQFRMTFTNGQTAIAYFKFK